MKTEDRTLGRHGTRKPRRAEVWLTDAQVDAIAAAGRKHGATPFVSLCAVIQMLADRGLNADGKITLAAKAGGA